MSSLSPRGSLSNVEAARAVSEDFGDSLKDLTQNNRYEISNLTIIAKENTEYAQAISQTLVGHIKSVRPLENLCGKSLVSSCHTSGEEQAGERTDIANRPPQ